MGAILGFDVVLFVVPRGKGRKVFPEDYWEKLNTDLCRKSWGDTVFTTIKLGSGEANDSKRIISE